MFSDFFKYILAGNYFAASFLLQQQIRIQENVRKTVEKKEKKKKKQIAISSSSLSVRREVVDNLLPLA